MRELRDAIHTGANTTHGKDRLSYELFQHLDDLVLEEILSLFYSVWAEGCLFVCLFQQNGNMLL